MPSSNVKDDLDELIQTEETKKQESPVNFDEIPAPDLDEKKFTNLESGPKLRPLFIVMVSLFICQFLAMFFIFKVYIGDKPEVDLTPMNKTFAEVVKLTPTVENNSAALALLKKDIEALGTRVALKDDYEKLSAETSTLLKQIAEVKSENSQIYNAVMEANAALKVVASDSSKLTGAVRQIQNNVASSNPVSGLSPSDEHKKEEQSGYRYKFKHIEVQEK